jgi:hypothetical protein
MKTSFNKVNLGEHGEKVAWLTFNRLNLSGRDKAISLQTITKLAACAVLAIGLCASAVASCGDAMVGMASGKAIGSS